MSSKKYREAFATDQEWLQIETRIKIRKAERDDRIEGFMKYFLLIVLVCIVTFSLSASVIAYITMPSFRSIILQVIGNNIVTASIGILIYFNIYKPSKG